MKLSSIKKAADAVAEVLSVAEEQIFACNSVPMKAWDEANDTEWQAGCKISCLSLSK